MSILGSNDLPTKTGVCDAPPPIPARTMIIAHTHIARLCRCAFARGEAAVRFSQELPLDCPSAMPWPKRPALPIRQSTKGLSCPPIPPLPQDVQTWPLFSMAADAHGAYSFLAETGTPAALTMGKVHGSLARAGKVKGQTPKIDKIEKKKQPRGRCVSVAYMVLGGS